MQVVVNSFEQWRTVARQLLQQRRHPADVCWLDASGGQRHLNLFGPEIAEASQPAASSLPSAAAVRVPRKFLEILEQVACHRSEAKWQLMYRALWRRTLGNEPHLLERITDDDVYELERMQRAVRRDEHRMKAFVRFRRQPLTADGDEPLYVAWYRPEHRIVARIAPHFAERFPDMRWAIHTPQQSVAWDKQQLSYLPGLEFAEEPSDEQLEALWRTYYAAVFNPARLNLDAMRRDMPSRYWSLLPELSELPQLVHNAPPRVRSMISEQEGWGSSAADYLPAESSLLDLAAAARSCQGCPLHCRATQTVFGQGPARARVMLIGEQPGDQEDLAGQPFVGPAGEVLDQALQTAGLDRQELYLTNAVKHFKWTPRGTRRLHQRPSSRELAACRPWLEAEVQAVRPELLVCLGATAVQAVLRRQGAIGPLRGETLPSVLGPKALVTWHPAAILRQPTDQQRTARFAELVADLRRAAAAIEPEADRREAC